MKFKDKFKSIKSMTRKEVIQMIISLVVVLFILLVLYGWIFPGIFQLKLQP